MHTLSVFPTLLDYAQFSPLFLRLALGIILGLMANHSFRAKIGDAPFLSPSTFRKDTIVHFLEFVAAFLLIVGLFTQIAALAAIIFIAIRWSVARKSFATFDQTALFTMLIVAALSLMLFGAGFFAFDLPL